MPAPALGNSDEFDAFLKAARYGDLDDVRELLRAHPELLWESDAFTKSTGMLLASANGHTEVVKVLLKEAGEEKKKTVANQANSQGNTPLHWAALNGHLDVCKLLVDAGADATTVNKAKHTPYDEALSRHFQEVCIYLAKFAAPEADSSSS
ncbi:Ankyrin repeat-containing protein YAR1, putative [Perkinsus marinus ATCC 50983]|uniref:Ankyrin repeat-containing protein YAR1, putative n=1 Tax=Perkinsus marinus (strain ATCC 50983 / TXsc) TaxID=423536 RepID=C5LLE7_PERM5|nr:Ankyrin repeat-containing protein YAR1, putative [Perkinsus marinus ATCC 50983]EER02446.1 Ankyrin repeat-containing protein YAR1, putative [Perkinsus marinus ATCC 50983]|eukprot:XP_002769728.1 Ankyrin repeat-containing protein YAR1, putative [Perkinsus marinus ATCC 50983]